jgi:TolA-binding protein
LLEGEDDPEFKSILADLNVEMGNIQKAKEIYLDVAQNSGAASSSSAFYKLAELYRGEDSLQRAVAYYDSAISRSSLSDHGIQAKKMADVLRRIEVLAQEDENKDRAQFLLAEIYYVDFNEPDKAMQEYQKVYTEYPQSPWAPKALYAHLWIVHETMHNDSLAAKLLTRLNSDYPVSEYTANANTLFGRIQEDQE